MTWLDMATKLAKQFEGCELNAYPDPTHGWALPTIGYGATGNDIVRGTCWTQAECDADLVRRMTLIGAHVDAFAKVPLTDGQKGALCDFAYNVGVHALEHSTLLRLLNEGDTQGAADEFGKWDLSAGHVLGNLVRRREAEKALFLLGVNPTPAGSAQPGESQPQPEQSI